MTGTVPTGREPSSSIQEGGASAPISEVPTAAKAPRWIIAALILYLIFFSIQYFSTRPPGPEPVSDEIQASTKTVEELHAVERNLLTTYGSINPATGTMRIPIERAMELLVIESAEPVPVNGAVPVAAPQPTAGVSHYPAPTPPLNATPPTSNPATTAAAPPASAVRPAVVAQPRPQPPAISGMPPVQLYRAICQACHDVDGRGSIVRKAMPVIPDFTDAKWQASRTDADLHHSILEGKGQLMLPMKDKFALAHTDVNEMIAFIRGFQPGRPVVAAGTQAQPDVAAPAGTALAPDAVASLTPVPPNPAPGSTPVASPTAAPAASVPAPAAAPSSAAALALASSSPAPPSVLIPSTSAAAMSAGSAPSQLATGPTSAVTEKLRAASELFKINCMVCHGPDGRGSTVRAAMPPIPDFTAREWQSTHDSALLSVSILEGKGTLMPPWRGKITPDQARDLVSYVRTFGPADLIASEKSPSDFGTRFRMLKKEWDDINREIQMLSRPK